jgi:DNA-binding response OmpR family regulator
MPVILICSPSALDAMLAHTMLWRHDMERHQAKSYEQALAVAIAAQPDLTIVDRQLPRAAPLIQSLRTEPKTRRTSVVVVADGDFEPAELELLEAGANAILRLPAGDTWDERLDALLRIPARKEARFHVDFLVEASLDGARAEGTAVNLSAHGMLLHTKTTLRVGDRLSVAFRLPTAFVSGGTRVVRLAGAAQYGLLFEAMDGDGREQVETYIASLPPS